MANKKTQLMTAFLAHEKKIAPRVAARHARVDARLKWYGDRVAQDINVPMVGRVKLAAQLLRDKVVANVSRPVYKYKKKLTKGPRKGRTVTLVLPESRSKPGEFPRAETSTLMRNVLWQMESDDKVKPTAQVLIPEMVQNPGTTEKAKLMATIDYAIVLETNKKLRRSYLKRTFDEMLPVIRNMIMGKPLP